MTRHIPIEQDLGTGESHLFAEGRVAAWPDHVCGHSYGDGRLCVGDRAHPNHQVEHCHAHSDGECFSKHCPQLRDGEPVTTGRSCPLPDWPDEE